MTRCTSSMQVAGESRITRGLDDSRSSHKVVPDQDSSADPLFEAGSVFVVRFLGGPGQRDTDVGHGLEALDHKVAHRALWEIAFCIPLS